MAARRNNGVNRSPVNGSARGSRANGSGDLKRIAFETSRAMELLTLSELQKQSGCYSDQFPALLVKELVDNGIDAAEYAKRPPKITIMISDEALTVRDNGDGFADGTVEGIIRFESRTSTNSKVAGLTRGSQGLGAKITAAVSYCVCQSEPRQGAVTISTRGRGKRLEIRANEVAGIPQATIQDVPPDVKSGTSVIVHWPQKASLSLTDDTAQILHLANCFALFNPHLSLKITTPHGEKTYQATDREWGRYPPWKVSPGAWFDEESFRGLLGATIAKLDERGESKTVREWTAENFAGLTGSRKSGNVVKGVGLSGAALSSLVADDGVRFDDQTVRKLYLAVRESSPNISRQRALGVIGEVHLRNRIQELGGNVGSFRYKVAYGVTADDRPFVFETAFAYLPERHDVACEDRRILIAGVNGSPSLAGCPFGRLRQKGGRDLPIDDLLDAQEADDYQPVLIFAHLTIPRPEWDGTGKSRLRLDQEVAEKMVSAIISVTKDWAKQRRREERKAAAELRREEELDRLDAMEEATLESAIWWEMETAIQEASGGGVVEFPARNLYYSVRELVQKHTEKPLTQSYFDKVLKRWEKEVGLIDKLYRDPRGHLIEPHTERLVQLGTREVGKYSVPEWLYHSMLYVEKKGFAAMFRQYALAERYDMGIVAAEGYATDAAKMLMAKAAESGHKMTMLCLHDADPYGKLIHQKAGAATLRSPQLQVIDIGLTLEEGIELGLAPENFIRKKALPKSLELTDLEREWWEGKPHGTYRTKTGKIRPKYMCKRIELNALAKNPPAFITYIERMLESVGCDRKLIPPAKVILEAAKDNRKEMARQLVQEEVDRVLDVEPIVNEVTAKVCRDVPIKSIPKLTRDWSQKLQPESWREMVEKYVRQLVMDQLETIPHLVAKQMK